MKTLDELKKELLVDGVIDVEEVKTIREVIFADGKIEKDEADFVFELNNAVSGNANAPEWKSLFVEAISAFLLEDETSPNEIDADEAEYVYKQIKGDGQIDDIERALLMNLKEKSKNFPDILASLL